MVLVSNVPRRHRTSLSSAACPRGHSALGFSVRGGGGGGGGGSCDTMTPIYIVKVDPVRSNRQRANYQKFVLRYYRLRKQAEDLGGWTRSRALKKWRVVQNVSHYLKALMTVLHVKAS